MYWLMSLDTILRITVALGFLFVAVPALAFPPRAGTGVMERFFWNLGVGIALLTLIGQILSLANLFSLLTLLILAGAIILAGRASQRGVGFGPYVKSFFETSFLALLNMFDKRVSVRRRVRRWRRRTLARLAGSGPSDDQRLHVVGWLAVVVVASGFRLYRPFASANLGFSDTYVHLYLLKLLGEGRQVDPEWGPYPRGLQFLLLSIQQLTNVDEILLMNFFGALVGVLMTIAVAETARRLSGSVAAAVVAGLVFATLVGGPGQYFIAGGAFSVRDQQIARTLQQKPYAELVGAGGQFDIVLTDFQRQTSTLSQELAIALLFPAALFLLGFLRTGDRWRLAGFAGGTAAIAAVHSGVLVPLVLMCALAVPAVAGERRLRWPVFKTAVSSGIAAIVVGSAWALAFFAYPYAGGKSHGGMGTSVATAAFYYFPFLRSLAPDAPAAVNTMPLFVAVTPFLVASVVVAIVWAVAWLRREEGAGRVWIAAVLSAFLLIHCSSRLGLPQLVEIVRNSQWLLMSLSVVLGMVVVDLAGLLAGWRAMTRRTALAFVAVPLLVLWGVRVPRLTQPLVRDQIVNFSGYGGAVLALLKIGRIYEPYTWTLVSYGQEFPMVLREGFHLPAATFLERYDPAAATLAIPTRHVFVIVEKTPHRFQIHAWARSFSRTDLEQRLQTWVHVYQSSHRNLRVFHEDEDVRVYRIDRTPEEMKDVMQEAATQ